jgi:hypothetical protein
VRSLTLRIADNRFRDYRIAVRTRVRIASKEKPDMESDRQHRGDMLARHAGRRFRGDAFGVTSFGERRPGGRASSPPQTRRSVSN